MKKTHILFGSVLLALAGTSAVAQTATFWDVPGGTTPTHTLGHVGIGTPTPITDAKLHIFNNPCDYTVPEQTIERWYWSGGACYISGSHPNYFEIKRTIATPGGGSTSTLIDAFDDQGWLKITPFLTGAPGAGKLHISGHSWPGVAEVKLDRTGSATSDYMQIWNTTTGGTPTSTKLDVIDHRGWLGINTSAPTQALHVNGNGLFEGGQLDLKMPTDGGWRNIDANSYIHGVTMSAGPEGAYMQLRAKYNSDPGAITIACGNSENGTGTTFFSFDGASGPWHHLMRIKPNGKVAIGEGIIAPENLPGDYGLYVLKGILSNGNIVTDQNLFVRGGLIDMGRMPGDLSDSWRAIKGNTTQAGLALLANTGAADGSGIVMYSADGYSGGAYSGTGIGDHRPGAIYYHSQGPNTSTNYQHMYLNHDPVSGYSALMGIQGNGKVVIGGDLLWAPLPPGATTHTPGDYLLYVGKGILTERLKVANASDAAWADFVFNSDYNLMPLSQVEEYVKTNKHLPEIPSEKQVKEEGIDVAVMDAKLLQKIEELTLYVIQQQKEIEILKKKIK